MQFDWFTFVAQIINFLVLVLLLKHFLYERIVKVMSQRDALITARLDEARTKEQEAEQSQAASRQELDQLKTQREAMLAAARQEVEAQRQELLTLARSEVDQLKAGWQAAVRREQESFLQEMRQRVGHQTCAIARQALRELADADLEQQAIERFLARLSSLDEARRADIAAALQTSPSKFIIRSAFEIGPALRRQIVQAVKAQLSKEVRPKFETAPDLVFGIELEAPGHKLTWHLEDYLNGLEEELAQTMKVEAGERVAA